MQSDATRNRVHRVAACMLVLILGACARPLVDVTLPPVDFEGPEKLATDVEVCVPKKLHARVYDISKHPYRVDLGQKAALALERLARSAFQDVVVDYPMGDRCGGRTDRPWFTAEIVSAKRDWDGIVTGDGFAAISDPEPVDTALTMRFELHADDDTELWSYETTTSHRSPGSVVERRRSQGSRDFGVVLANALEAGHAALLAAPELRAAFPAPPPEDAVDE